MRSAQKNNRSRGRGNRKGGGGGGGGNVANRVYDSAGPEGKVRGTPQQVIDKYLSLARDAQTSNDRVAAENFLQHAEHYQRLLMTATAQQQEQSRRDNDQGQDDDGDDRDDRDNRDSRDSRDGSRDGGGRDGRDGSRDEGGDDVRATRDDARPERPERRTQQRNGARNDGNRIDGNRDENGVEGDEIGGMTTIDPVRPASEDLLVVAEDVTQSQPRRNGDGRRRRQRRDADAPVDAGQTDADQSAKAQQEN